MNFREFKPAGQLKFVLAHFQLRRKDKKTQNKPTTPIDPQTSFCLEFPQVIFADCREALHNSRLPRHVPNETRTLKGCHLVSFPNLSQRPPRLVPLNWPKRGWGHPDPREPVQTKIGCPRPDPTQTQPRLSCAPPLWKRSPAPCPCQGKVHQDGGVRRCRMLCVGTLWGCRCHCPRSKSERDRADLDHLRPRCAITAGPP